MKKCRQCKKKFDIKNLIKSCVSYYKRKKYLYFSCNPCNTKRVKIYRKTISGNEKIKKIASKQYLKYKLKQSARMKFNRFLAKNPSIKPVRCEKCLKNKKLDAHHENYLKPLEVIWLCRLCHIHLHRPKLV